MSRFFITLGLAIFSIGCCLAFIALLATIFG